MLYYRPSPTQTLFAEKRQNCAAVRLRGTSPVSKCTSPAGDFRSSPSRGVHRSDALLLKTERLRVRGTERSPAEKHDITCAGRAVGAGGAGTGDCIRAIGCTEHLYWLKRKHKTQRFLQRPLRKDRNHTRQRWGINYCRTHARVRKVCYANVFLVHACRSARCVRLFCDCDKGTLLQCHRIKHYKLNSVFSLTLHPAFKAE